MTFHIEGRSKHELMPIERLFDRRLVNKAGQVKSSHAIDQKEWYENDKRLLQHRHRLIESYQSVTNITDEVKVVCAEQIMSSPIKILEPDTTVKEAAKIFHKYKFRHFPVVSSDGELMGVISDRDVLMELDRISYVDEGNTSQIISNKKVEDIMVHEVLTANKKTDVRYIVLLFVENHIGSIPIMHESKLVGIITRSDVLKAILRHYEIELWT